MPQRLALLLFAAATARADSDALPAPRSEGELTLRFFPGMEAAARLMPHRLSGPTLSLARRGDTLEGTIARWAAKLELGPSSLGGFAREGAVALHAERSAASVVVRGSYGAAGGRPRAVLVEIGPAAVRVQDGGCALELARTGGGPFRGGGFCGESWRQAELYLDEGLRALAAAEPEIVALMILESTLALH